MFSHGWNRVESCGTSRRGATGALAPAPVTTTRLGLDQVPASRSRATACARQKYVPDGIPLITSRVVSAPGSSLSLRSITFSKVDDRLSCQL